MHKRKPNVALVSHAEALNAILSRTCCYTSLKHPDTMVYRLELCCNIATLTARYNWNGTFEIVDLKFGEEL